MSVKFITHKRGVYTPREQAIWDRTMERLKDPSAGPQMVTFAGPECLMPPQPRPAGGPGGPGGPGGGPGGEGPGGMGGPPPMRAKGDLKVYARYHDPYNPLYNDEEYAKGTRFGGLIAAPGYFDPAGHFPMIDMDFGDELQFSHDYCECEMFEPVRPGDILTCKDTKKSIEDITEDGSEIRALRMYGEAEFYNQNGVLVGRGSTSGRNYFKTYAEDSDRPDLERNEAYSDHSFFDDMGPEGIWPIHNTTDEEWQFLREKWASEKIRGSEVLYWEDVNVGDQPWDTITHPITYMDMCQMNPDSMMDFPTVRELMQGPKDMIAALLEGGDHGLRYMAGCMHYGNIGYPNGRLVFYNFTARDFILRMVSNWIGDAGWIRKYGWCFQQLYRDLRVENVGKEYLEKVPFMKGKGCNRHGTEGDCVWAKGYVTDKYVNEKGEHLVDIACWAETLDQDIIQVCPITVLLPSRQDRA